jgi:hypothetical protein
MQTLFSWSNKLTALLYASLLCGNKSINFRLNGNEIDLCRDLLVKSDYWRWRCRRRSIAVLPRKLYAN